MGDEIVAIGDTPVCTSSYQEICDLMHNLPVTLTLEIQKPVSGEFVLVITMLLLSEVFFKEMFRNKTVITYYNTLTIKPVTDLVCNMQHCFKAHHRGIIRGSLLVTWC